MFSGNAIMAAPINDDSDEKPLDPAVERVRRKLVRFVAVNLGLLMAAVMAVIGAIVYKWEPGGTARDDPSPVAAASAPGDILSGQIELPSGARVLSHAVSGNRLSLHVEAGGSGSILVYDMAAGRITGRFELIGE
jgi:hypothetical protein